MDTLWDALDTAEDSRETVIYTVAEGAHAGEKLLVSENCIHWQSENAEFLSGHIQKLLPHTESGLVSVDGEQIFVDPLSGEKKLVICGAGHVSMPIIRIGKMLGFQITVIEDRPAFADDARRAGAGQVLCLPFAEGLADIPGDKNTYFIIVTRGHRYDEVCLESILPKEYAYIGMMGSRRRVAVVKQHLLEQGFEKQKIEELHAPIGLSIAAETPEEIAVSILAEIIEEKNKKRRSQGFTKDMLRAVRDAGDAQMVMATIVSRRGSAPRSVGTKMLVLADGRCIDTIGGGCMEAEVRNRALRLMHHADRQTQVCGVDMTAMDAEEEGMVCGGRIEVLLEKADSFRGKMIAE